MHIYHLYNGKYAKPLLLRVFFGYSLQECDYLRAIARPRLQISTVVDVATGKVCGLASNL